MSTSKNIRHFPFFAGVSHDHLDTIANFSEEISVDADTYFFHEGQVINQFYLVSEGKVAIVVNMPKRDRKHTVSEQLTREYQTEEAILSTVGPGDVFGWTGMVPDHRTTAGAKTLTPCQVLIVDCDSMRELFKQDCQFAYLMMQKIAQVIRSRLRDMHMEALQSR